MITDHTLETLEYPKVIAGIAGKCLTPFGPELVNHWRPMFDPALIRTRQQEVAQMTDIIRFGTAFPLSRIEDCRPALAESAVPGNFLEPADILYVCELIELVIALHGYDPENRSKYPALVGYLTGLRPFPELRKKIRKALDETGEVRDDASPALRRIRLEIADTRRKVISKLEGFLSKQKKQPGWTDDVVTSRSGRYVVPVPSVSFRGDLGILHDRSQSGATLYVEPPEAVELNNRLGMLEQEERQEIARILIELTAGIAQCRTDLETAIGIIAHLDALHAAGQFAAATSSRPVRLVDTPRFNLVEARHPMLNLQLGVTNVIPLSLALDDSRQAVVVTGPNTGGKTVALKTIGLLILMAQTGLPVPAEDRSEIGLFKTVHADIGDEQSLELSLSTFSSHMRNIVAALSDLSPDSLILFDEIGAGTDPKEGAALAEAIIKQVVATGARLVATTHYSQLKTLALDLPEVDNASLEFDRKTLAPTYRLQVGLPGSSYAVEIAARLGLPSTVCEQAAKLVGSEERSLNELIASLEQELARIRKDRMELEERLAAATALEAKYNTLMSQSREEIAAQRAEQLSETSTLLDEARKEAEHIVAEIRKNQADAGTVKSAHQKLRQLTELTAEQKRKYETPPPVAPTDRFEVGDKVHILSLNADGEVVSLLGADKARVQVGGMTTTVELRNLQKLSADAQTRIRVRPVSRVEAAPVASREIHLRGMTVEEATEALERFIDQAVVTGQSQIYVIHGKGTGALRRSITQYLKSHPEVAEIRLGNWNEGGAGVTIVRLRE